MVYYIKKNNNKMWYWTPKGEELIMEYGMFRSEKMEYRVGKYIWQLELIVHRIYRPQIK